MQRPYSVTLSILIFGVLALATGPCLSQQAARVRVGDQAPLFRLETSSGESLDLESLRGEKNALLVFFRGTW